MPLGMLDISDAYMNSAKLPHVHPEHNRVAACACAALACWLMKMFIWRRSLSLLIHRSMNPCFRIMMIAVQLCAFVFQPPCRPSVLSPLQQPPRYETSALNTQQNWPAQFAASSAAEYNSDSISE